MRQKFSAGGRDKVAGRLTLQMARSLAGPASTGEPECRWLPQSQGRFGDGNRTYALAVRSSEYAAQRAKRPGRVQERDGSSLLMGAHPIAHGDHFVASILRHSQKSPREDRTLGRNTRCVPFPLVPVAPRTPSVVIPDFDSIRPCLRPFTRHFSDVQLNKMALAWIRRSS